MKNTLVLKDSTEIELHASSGIQSIQILFPSMELMVDTYNKMTTENLSHVQMYIDNEMYGNYLNLKLISETSVRQQSGEIITTFSLSHKSDLELQVEDLRSITDGAIYDLGNTVGALAEERGLL